MIWIRQHRLGPSLAAPAAAVACLAVLAGCSTPTDSSRAPDTPRTPTAPVSTAPVSTTAAPGAVIEADYRPGLPAGLRLPATPGAAPLVVLVPGGGWSSADPTGLVPLAERLTEGGTTTSLITYSTTGDGSTFPTGVDDVACAVRWSVQEATGAGYPPTHVVVLGHSAGGHLAALVALSGDAFGGDCPYASVRIDGLVGLAGVYDIGDAAAALMPWIGATPAQDPRAWHRADPMRWLTDGGAVPEGLRVALLHGDADGTVPTHQTTRFADALVKAGVDVRTTLQPGLDHMSVFTAENAEPPIRAWLDAWPAG